jgi:hypothetical protein
VHDKDVLRRIGSASAAAIKAGDVLVNRRVESVEFPATAPAGVRRRVSIDFNVPGEGMLEPLLEDGANSVYYLPLSVLKKWPPVRRLDLRDPAGRPFPLLTRSQNAVADAALLTRLASDVLELDDERALDRYLVRQLTRIAEERSAVAEVVWNELFEYAPRDEASPFNRQRGALREDDYFLNIAGGLVENTVLWFRVTGRPGSRHIAKFAYDAPVKLSNLRGWTPASLGWQPLNVCSSGRLTRRRCPQPSMDRRTIGGIGRRSS